MKKLFLAFLFTTVFSLSLCSVSFANNPAQIKCCVIATWCDVYHKGYTTRYFPGQCAPAAQCSEYCI